MVAGLLKFKEYFKDYADSYVLIGGAACDISSLSAILLDDDYYQVLLNGRVMENGFSVLRPE